MEKQKNECPIVKSEMKCANCGCSLKGTLVQEDRRVWVATCKKCGVVNEV